MKTTIVMPPRKGWFDPCGEWVGDGYDAEWNAALDEVLRLNTTPPQPAEVGELVSDLKFLAEYVWSERCSLPMPNYQALGRFPLDVAKAALAKLEGKV